MGILNLRDRHSGGASGKTDSTTPTAEEKSSETTEAHRHVSVEQKQSNPENKSLHNSPHSQTKDNSNPSPRTTKKISLSAKSTKPSSKTTKENLSPDIGANSTSHNDSGSNNNGPDNRSSSSQDAVRLNLDLAKTAQQFQQEQEEAEKAAHENTLQNLKVEFPERFYQVEGFDSKKFEQNMAVIHTKMEADDPDIGNYLLDIYQNLKKYPEVSTLLTNEQIGLIVNGFKTFKSEEIKTSAPKKKPLVDFSGKSDKEVLDLEF